MVFATPALCVIFRARCIMILLKINICRVPSVLKEVNLIVFFCEDLYLCAYCVTNDFKVMNIFQVVFTIVKSSLGAIP